MSGRRGAVRVLVLAAVACAAGCANDSGGKQIPAPQPVEVEGVRNARRAGELLFGGQPTREALAELAKEGYRTVVNTRGEDELDWDEKGVVDSLGMTYVAIPMAYPIESIPDEWVSRFDAVMRDDPRPMFLHCSSGNRVAGLWAVWLAERDGVDPSRALELGQEAGMTRIGPVVEKRLRTGPDGAAHE